MGIEPRVQRQEAQQGLPLQGLDRTKRKPPLPLSPRPATSHVRGQAHLWEVCQALINPLASWCPLVAAMGLREVGLAKRGLHA